jgi:hypothetical protein
MSRADPNPTEVLADLIPRIRAAAAEARDAADAAMLRQRQRDQLIVQAVDAGVSQRRIVAILGNSVVEELI